MTILNRPESARFTRNNSSNIVLCFTSLIVASLDIIRTSLFLAQKYEKVTIEKIKYVNSPPPLNTDPFAVWGLNVVDRYSDFAISVIITTDVSELV